LYHTRDHLAACLAGLEGGTFVDPDAVATALWYHDAVYDTTRADNEAASAALARAHRSAAGAPEAAIARVEALIDATRHAAEPGEDPRVLAANLLFVPGVPLRPRSQHAAVDVDEGPGVSIVEAPEADDSAV
jgi:predicted metal-dependent HD superfamily phosphohydrolase